MKSIQAYVRRASHSLHQKRTSERGQISLFMGMLMVTFLILIMFVINVGMLVNAKINLQNAADLAAYSGAAVMARQMNSISYLNYDMRQQYKKFLMRYNVIGNRFYDSARAATPGSPREYYASNNDPVASNYGVPVVCLQFSARGTGNFCRVDVLPAIPQIPSIVGDPINGSLSSFLATAEANRANKCEQIKFLNGMALHLWLYNVDPGLDQIQAQIAAESVDAEDNVYVQGLNLIKGLMYGIGLVPRNIFHLERIKTLQYYVNYPPQQNMDLATMQAFSQGEGDLAAKERTIQAFYSAYYTLGAHSFPANTIKLTEMMPVGGANGEADLLSLEPIRISFDSFYLAYDTATSGGSAGFPCNSYPTTHKVLNAPIGVRKDPTKLVYYSIKLEATPRILFSPFSDLTMTAYSAAQPFGSRIGPQFEDSSEFVATERTPNLRGQTEDQVCGAGGCLGVPNLRLAESDEIGIDGFFRGDIHSTINDAIVDSNDATGNGLNYSKLAALERIIMSPNPVEKGLYNILSDQPDSFMSFFDRAGEVDPNAFEVRTPEEIANNYHAIYAPISSEDVDPSDAEQQILNAIDEAADGGSLPGQQQYLEALKQHVSNYLGQIRGTASGENQETYYVAYVKNPLYQPPLDNRETRVALPPDTQMTEPLELRSSWANQNNADGQDPIAPGRIGYSVKFVALSDLVEGNIKPDNSTSMENTLGGDSDFEAHRERIQH